MREFSEIFAIAAERKGGDAALEALLKTPLDAQALAAIPDDRWLSMMTKCVFQAGFNWKVIEAKWDGFEAAFEGFDPEKVARYADPELDRLLADKGIVRNYAKIAASVDNARFVRALAAEHGGAGRYFGSWPTDRLDELLEEISKNGSRLGGATGQRMLRFLGRDTYMMSPDVVARLVAEGVIDKAPSSKKAMSAVQQAFNTWAEQSGRSLTEISQVLAFSV